MGNTDSVPLGTTEEPYIMHPKTVHPRGHKGAAFIGRLQSAVVKLHLRLLIPLHFQVYACVRMTEKVPIDISPSGMRKLWDRKKETYEGRCFQMSRVCSWVP